VCAARHVARDVSPNLSGGGGRPTTAHLLNLVNRSD